MPLKEENWTDYDHLLYNIKGKARQIKSTAAAKLGMRYTKQIEEEKFYEQGIEGEHYDLWASASN